MAETVQETILAEQGKIPEEQVTAAMNAAFGTTPGEGDRDGEQAKVDGDAKESESGDEVKVSREKLQQQNRELGNMKRELQELKGLKAEIAALKESKTTPDKSQANERDEADDLSEELTALSKNGFADEERAKKVFGRLGSLLKKVKSGTDAKELKQQLEDVKKQLHSVSSQTESERSFFGIYPELEGRVSYQRLSEAAWKHARDQYGDDKPVDYLQGIADHYLNTIAGNLSRQGKNPPKDQGTVDRTAMMKPAESTRGTASVKHGAAPGKPANLTQRDIMRVKAQMLEEETRGKDAQRS